MTLIRKALEYQTPTQSSVRSAQHQRSVRSHTKTRRVRTQERDLTTASMRTRSVDERPRELSEMRRLRPAASQELATVRYSGADSVATLQHTRAFIGSQNLSATSLDQKRELGIIVEDAVNLARLMHTFKADFRSATPQETP